LFVFFAGEADTGQFDIYANTGFSCITAGADCCQWVLYSLIRTTLAVVAYINEEK